MVIYFLKDKSSNKSTNLSSNYSSVEGGVHYTIFWQIEMKSKRPMKENEGAEDDGLLPHKSTFVSEFHP